MNVREIIPSKFFYRHSGFQPSWGIGIALGLLLGFGLVFSFLLANRSPWAYQQAMQPQLPVSLPISRTDANATSLSDSTAGWKEYKNAKLGYRVKYPSNWVSREYQMDDGEEWQDFTNINSEASSTDHVPAYLLRIYALRKINQEGSGGPQTDQSYFNYLYNARVGATRTNDPRYLITKLDNLHIDGYPAVRQIKETAPDAQTEHTYGIEVYILKGTQLYEIEAKANNEYEWKLFDSTFDRVLQSFQFDK